MIRNLLLKFFTLTKISKPMNVVILLGLSISIPISVAHHLFNFWGLSWRIQVLILIALVPALYFLLSNLYSRIQGHCPKIEGRRWVLFTIPAFLVVSALTWKLYSPPVVWHTLKLIPSQAEPGVIQLLQIRAGSNLIGLSQIKAPDGWLEKDGMLTNQGKSSNPVEVAFLGPIGVPVRLLFLASAEGKDITIVLDGKAAQLSLIGLQADQRVALMTTEYKQGIPAGLINSIVALTDFITFAFFLLFIWLIQEIPQRTSNAEPRNLPETFVSHKTGLTILLILSFVLHLVNFLAVPLLLRADSMSYLEGAIHWIQYHDLSGVSLIRGPGTTFLFLPGMLLFRRNPWGVKITLHILAMACVPLSYRLGWQLSRRRWFAFSSGLIAALIPDLFFYSNLVMSEVPNTFLGLAFLTLLLSALETPTFGWILSATLVGSFSTLVRPENLIFLVLGAVFLFASTISEWQQLKNFVDLKRRSWQIAVSCILAVLPILAWSAHNLNQYGFFGLTNYWGAALYDGWIYFGERSHIPIAAKDSPEEKLIFSLFPNELEDPRKSPTSWAVFDALKQKGYADLEIYSILEQATLDSLRKNRELATKLFFIKIREGFSPATTATITFPLPGERSESVSSDGSGYFEPEEISFPALINLQRSIYLLLDVWFRDFYLMLTWFGLAVAVLCLYRKPFWIWFSFVSLTLTRVFVPTILALSHWRYIISGIIPIFIFLLVAPQSLVGFLRFVVTSSSDSKKENNLIEQL